MAYSLRFVAKAATTKAALVDYFRGRRGYRIDNQTIGYANADTGVSFSFAVSDDAPSEQTNGGSESGQEKRAALTLTIESPRPPIFGLEAEMEASLLATHFGLEVPSEDDPDSTARPENKNGDADEVEGAEGEEVATAKGKANGAGESRPYTPDVLIRGYAQANASAHKALLDAGGEYQELPSTVLSSAWRWNLQRSELERLHGDQTFIPRVVCTLHPDTGQACTASVWPDLMPAFLPHVDILILTNHDERFWVPTRDIAHLLELVGVRSPRFCYRLGDRMKEAGLRHYDVSKDTETGAEILACARRYDEPPVDIPMETVLSRELSRMAMGIVDVSREKKDASGEKKDGVKKKPTFPRECDGFVRTTLYDLASVLGGYTWLSPWRIESIAVSEDASIIAGVGAGGVVFFDADSGSRVREIRGDVCAGTSVGISGDGKTLAVGDELGNVNVFDVDLTGGSGSGSGMAGTPTLMKRCVHGIHDHEKIVDGSSVPYGYVIGVSKDGSVVIGGAGDHVFVLRDGEEPTSFEVHGAVCASRDLSRIWTGTSIRDLAPAKTEATGDDSVRLEIDPRLVRVPALSPDGLYLTFTTPAGYLQVVRLADGAVIAAVSRKDASGKPAVARFIAYTPSGTKLVVGDSTGLEVLTALTLEREKAFETPAWDAALSDTVIYQAREDRIWTQPLEGPAPPVNDGPITQLFHSARGPIAVALSAPLTGDSMTGGRAILWHLPSGAVLRATDRLCPDRINLSPDGRLLCLATESSLRVLDVGTLKEVAVVEPLGSERFVRPIDLDASPDGEHVLACLEGGLARMISIKTGIDLWREEYLGIKCATFTPDGTKIIAGDPSRLRIVDAATGSVDKEIAIDDSRDDAEHVLLGDGTRAVRVIPAHLDNDNDGIGVIDLASGESITQPVPNVREVLAASPDGGTVALAVRSSARESANEELVLWSVDAGAEVDRIRFETAEDAPVSAAFSPDGSRLLVGTSRGALLVFSKR